jgi:arsenate reductase
MATQASITLYGIKNCETVKKARAWLDAHDVAYVFHDYKTSGIDRARLEAWCRTHRWERICNRAGTTFKKLPDAAKADLTEARAIALMLEQPSMIKRPIVETARGSIVGFSPELYGSLVPS